ncbi:MAG: MarC family protein [Candidatus Methanomethylicia archaeon]|nr:MarC family protein [Candidatus Methanomethylicia archaeon]MCQ5373753.1 MarC family protein [Candidatus Methanomethylicia archaeon]
MIGLIGDPSAILTQIVFITGQIFAILNPISVIPTFLSLTDDLDVVERHRIVRNSSFAVLIIALALALGGSYLLSFFHVSISSLQVGGGVLLMAIAIEMLGGLPRTKSLESHTEVAIVPIATPLLVGPGTMTTIIVLSGIVPLLLLIISIFIVAFITYLLLRYSDILVRVLGRNGIRAMGRFMTIIIAAFAAQLIYSGVTEWLKSWHVL